MDKSLPQLIRRRLSEARESTNSSIEKWADLAGISSHLYANFEKGVRPISLLRMIQICKRAGISARWLLLGKSPHLTKTVDPTLTDKELRTLRRNIPERLKKARIERSWSKEATADALDWPVKYYKLFEQGRTPIGAERIVYICEKLNISPEWLLLGDHPYYLNSHSI